MTLTVVTLVVVLTLLWVCLLCVWGLYRLERGARLRLAEQLRQTHDRWAADQRRWAERVESAHHVGVAMGKRDMEKAPFTGRPGVEGPVEHIRNALAILTGLSVAGGGNPVLSPPDRAAVVRRLWNAVHLLEGKTW